MLQKVSLHNAYDIFLLSCESRSLTQDTLAFYRNKLKHFISTQQVEYIHDLEPTAIRLYFLTLQKQGMASHSVHAHARAIRAWLNFCVEDGLLATNPFNKVVMPKTQKLKPVILSADEIKTVLNACTTLRDKLIISLSLDTAIRANELVSLDFGHIQDSKVFIHDGKNQKDRITFIGKKTSMLLLKYQIERNKPTPNQPLLTTPKHQRLTRSGLMQFYERLRDTTGIEHLSSHTIRRTALTIMLKSGMSLYHLKEIAGHEDIKTLQHYINVDDDIQNAHIKFGVIDNL